MSERPDGYYWVNFRGHWSPCQCSRGLVFIGAAPFKESDVDEIGPPCNRDDSEQLRLAREVLRLLKGYASTLEVFGHQMAGSSIASTIELSGVRL